MLVKHVNIRSLHSLFGMSGFAAVFNGNIHRLVAMPKALECSGLPFTPTLRQIYQLIQWILPLEH